jgi:hypothetical protein
MTTNANATTNGDDAVSQASSIIEARIAELEPLAAELARLVKARDSLAGTAVTATPKRRGRPPGSKTTA